jgi:uncharacterized repeat protein (TIGR03803 family)
VIDYFLKLGGGLLALETGPLMKAPEKNPPDDREVGNLYGTTAGGGPYGVGTAFKLTRRSPIMQWQKSILHNFGEGVDGVYPWLGLVFDAAGNL